MVFGLTWNEKLYEPDQYQDAIDFRLGSLKRCVGSEKRTSDLPYIENLRPEINTEVNQAAHTHPLIAGCLGLLYRVSKRR